jgi:hypothetical protein
VVNQANLVGPSLSRRQFVGAIVSGALSTIQVHGRVLTNDNPDTNPEAKLVAINAIHEEEYGQVKVSARLYPAWQTLSWRSATM